jgi:NAD(P) transhydrogenase
MNDYDCIVIGSGPAGQKAAVQAAKAGQRVLVIEREARIGGECVQRGTIPSKALRHRTVLQALLGASGPVDLGVRLRDVDRIVDAHGGYMHRQLERNGVDVVRAQAAFVDARRVAVVRPGGAREVLAARFFVIATGSVPRRPPSIDVDHENVLDSDSVLTLAYLPQSLVVLGGGVIACEYASMFSLLGVRVSIVDQQPRPLTFLEPELSTAFVEALQRRGAAFIGGARIDGVEFDGVASTAVRLADGRVLHGEKVLCALGRAARVDGLCLDNAGVTVGPRGVIEVNAHGQTSVPWIYAAGDVAGPPGLASAAMEQGRRASRHALGLPLLGHADSVPSGIYTYPELASVGLGEAAALQVDPGATVGRAHFDEIARGQISGIGEGFLKLVAGADGRLLGVHVAGEGACELVHVGQMALAAGASVEIFVEQIFNFPTLAEAYRVAALDVLGRLALRTPAAALHATVAAECGDGTDALPATRRGADRIQPGA